MKEFKPEPGVDRKSWLKGYRAGVRARLEQEEEQQSSNPTNTQGSDLKQKLLNMEFDTVWLHDPKKVHTVVRFSEGDVDKILALIKSDREEHWYAGSNEDYAPPLHYCKCGLEGKCAAWKLAQLSKE